RRERFCFSSRGISRKNDVLVDRMSTLLGRVQELQGRLRRQQRAGTLSTASVLLLGFLFLFPLKLGEGLKNLSYDFPFKIRALLPVFAKAVPTNHVVIVYMDDRSGAELKEPSLDKWNRRRHADLIDELKAAGTEAIVFDVLFDQPSPTPEADTDLARAAAA